MYPEYPFENGWADIVRNIDPNRVTLGQDERLRKILYRFKEWNLFPNPSPRIASTQNGSADLYFYFLCDGPVTTYNGNAYVGFLVPDIYQRMFEKKHGPNRASRPLNPVELVFSIKSKYGFNPNAGGLNYYNGGPYRQAHISGAACDKGTADLWIVEFENEWNCREVWLEKTQAIRNINRPN